MEEAKVLYIFGAGASYGALPVVEGLADDMRIMADDLDAKYGGRISDARIHEDHKTFCESLRSLADMSEKYGTPDTYISSLSKRGEDIKKFKNTLSLYFLIKQILDGKQDRRYYDLFSHIEAFELGKSVYMFSWNYDYQAEFAIDECYGNSASQYFQGFPSYKIESRSRNLRREIALTHFNGIAGMMLENGACNQDFLDRKYEIGYESLLKFYYQKIYIYRASDVMHFGFKETQDNIPYKDAAVEIAERIAKRIDVVVAIGYSFPVANRNIDARYFECFKKENGGRSPRIYVQAPNADGIIKDVKTHFELSDEFQINAELDVDKFFIPKEIWGGIKY